MIKEALLYEKLDDDRTRCHLCSHNCTISPSKYGICGVRQNREGTLYTLVYGIIIAENVDPIEKKPLFHVYPGSRSFSIATVGCNFRCTFCQNSDISQMPHKGGKIVGREVTPHEIVDSAIKTGSKTIAYTYTEPTIYFELAYDTAKIAKENHIKNVFVTNGFMTPEAIGKISPYLDAANVDLKSFRDGFYKGHCGARLQPVLDSLQRMKESGIWVEVTTLIIPSLNDSDEELTDIAEFIGTLGKETPWHISRFHPQYKMTNIRSTPLSTLRRAREIGTEAGLKYVYTGNVPGDEGENTYCSSCGNLLIGRYGYRINQMNLEGSRCSQCDSEMDGIL